MPITLSIALHNLNKEIVYVRGTSEIAELNPAPGESRLKFMSPHSFKNADYANRILHGDKRSVALANAWLKWSDRRTVNRTVYEPGQSRITAENNLNTWFPSSNVPKAGDLTLWHKYLNHIFASDPTYRDWFLAWLAYPLQNPGAKLHTAVVLWSAMSGTGKSTLAYIMKEIYGQHNCSLLRESDFTAAYNGWAVGKVFVEVDEMPEGSRARQRAELLKSFTTRHTIPVDLKYQNRYEIRDTINWYYTSNHLESLYLDPHDRRFFIHNVGDTKLSEEFFRKEFGPWLKAEGFSAIHHYLLHDVDLSHPVAGGNPYSSDPAPFSPGAAAPLTKSRQEVIEAGYDDVEGWLRDMVINPDLLGSEYTLFTSVELYRIFREQFPEIKCGPQRFARKLNEQHLQVNDGGQIRINSVTRLRLYSLLTEVRVGTVSQLKLRWSQERGVTCDDLND